MTAPDHLRITGPEDILGFIPHSLGYWPENSLVAMTLQGKRLGATLRVDLPVPGGGSGRRDMLAGFARNVVSYLQADDAADGSLLAFFTDADADADTETDSAGDGHAWADLLKELELALEAAGLPLRDAWIIGTEFWRNAHCSDPDCCGMPGRPVEQIRNSRLNAEMVYRGSSVGAVPGAQGTSPAPLPVDPAVSLAECGWAEQFSPRRRDRAQFDQVLDVWMMAMQAAIGQEHLPVPTPGDVARACRPRRRTTDSGAPDHRLRDARRRDRRRDHRLRDARSLDHWPAASALTGTRRLPAGQPVHSVMAGCGPGDGGRRTVRGRTRRRGLRYLRPRPRVRRFPR